MGIKKSDAEFTEPFVGTTEVIIMMSVQGGRSTSSAVRLDYNAVHALEKAIVDYTFLDDTPQTDAEIPKNALRSDCTGCRFVGTYDTEFPCANCVRKNKDYYSAMQTERCE